MTVLHKNQKTVDGIHIPYSFEYATATARLAAYGFTPQDNGKLARQLDNNSLWMLTDSVNVTWQQITLTAAMLTKLNGIQAGAETNQNAISVIDVPNADIEATSKTDQIRFVGAAGINIFGDAANKTITFSTIGHGASHLPNGVDALPLATEISPGLLDSPDKIKLNQMSPLIAGDNITLTPVSGSLMIQSVAAGQPGSLHSSLSGLSDDDHLQYLNAFRHNAHELHTLGVVVPHDVLHNLTDVTIQNPQNNQILTFFDGQWINASADAAGSPIAHDSLTNLNQDDHLQYLNNMRHNSPLLHQLGSVVPHDALIYLTDVVINAPQEDEILSFTNGYWANKAMGDTHSHALSSVNGLVSALDSKISVSQKGVENGIATLNSIGKIPLLQLPDEILQTGSVSHQYLLDLDTDSHAQYLHLTSQREINASHIWHNGMQLLNNTSAASIFAQPITPSPFIVYRSNLDMDLPIVDIATNDNKNSILKLQRTGALNNTLVPCVSLSDEATDGLGISAPTLLIQSQTSVAAIDVINNSDGYLMRAATATGKGIKILMNSDAQHALDIESSVVAGSDIKITHQSSMPAIDVVNNSSNAHGIKVEQAGENAGIYCLSNNGIAIHGRAPVGQVAIYAEGAGDLEPGLLVRGMTRISSLAGYGNRSVYVNENGILIPESSDRALKKNVALANEELDIMGIVTQLQGICFNWDAEHPAAANLGMQRELGFIAQDVEKVLPTVVGTTNIGLKTLDYARIVVVLTEAIKIQQQRLDNLEEIIKNKLIASA